MLVGCSSTLGRSPNDPGIPEARTQAETKLDGLISRIEFSDEAIVLGTGRGDSCGFGTSGVLWSPPRNYRCWMTWAAYVVIPDAVSREDVAAALDAEIAAMDVPIDDTVVRALVSTHPNNVGNIPIGVSGVEHGMHVVFETRPFQADFWPVPVAVSGNVSSSGDLGDVTAADVAETGAKQIIVVRATIEYWSDVPPRDPDPAHTRLPLAVEHSAYGDYYSFDVAQAEPAEAVDVCRADPTVEPTSITHQDDPFSRTTFKLYGTAVREDAIRIRDCLTGSLTSGTIAWYEPSSRGGESPTPPVTPAP